MLIILIILKNRSYLPVTKKYSCHCCHYNAHKRFFKGSILSENIWKNMFSIFA